jgi:hypothetical protein
VDDGNTKRYGRRLRHWGRLGYCMDGVIEIRSLIMIGLSQACNGIQLS